MLVVVAGESGALQVPLSPHLLSPNNSILEVGWEGGGGTSGLGLPTPE